MHNDVSDGRGRDDCTHNSHILEAIDLVLDINIFNGSVVVVLHDFRQKKVAGKMR